MRGYLITEVMQSKILKGNPAKEPELRHFQVYMPEKALKSTNEKFPLIILLAPWTNNGFAMLTPQTFKEPFGVRVERIAEELDLPPAIIVAPDLCTFYGGSQFIDSSYFGAHQQFITEELIPYMEFRYPVKEGAAYRAAMGRSSGGYGALQLAMQTDSIAAAAVHSADMGFELLFKPDLAMLADQLARYDGKVSDFMSYTRQAKKLERHDVHLLMLLGSCGFYSPNPHHPDGFDLPVDLHYCRIKEDVWSRWLQHDPLYQIKKPQFQSRLKNLKELYIECGSRDQYRLHYGARELHSKLSSYEINHTYEEFKDNHSGTDYRYDVSLKKILPLLQ